MVAQNTEPQKLPPPWKWRVTYGLDDAKDIVEAHEMEVDKNGCLWFNLFDDWSAVCLVACYHHGYWNKVERVVEDG